MKKNRKSQKVIITVLFLLYLVILIWIILFKLQFSISALSHIRSVNFIPFHYSVSVGARFHLKEVIENVLIFIPFGIYLCMLKSNLKLWKKIAAIVGSSLALETMQYILAIGGSDITDLITNSLGGIIGIGAYSLIIRNFKKKEIVDKAIIIVAIIVNVVLLGVLSILLTFNN